MLATVGAREAQVFGFVAEAAERKKALELLDAAPALIAPCLMAMKRMASSCAPSADLASIGRSLEDRVTDGVSLIGSDDRAHVRVPARARHELDRQPRPQQPGQCPYERHRTTPTSSTAGRHPL
jgi:hypothetical protein